MDKDDKLRLAEIHATVKTISVGRGGPGRARRLRERKELVGFNVGRRRLYFQTEIYDYLSRLERVTRKQPEQSMEQ